MQTFEREIRIEEQEPIINPQVLEMVEALKAGNHTVELSVQALRDYSESLWKDYQTGPEELRQSADLDALAEAMEKDREWSGQLYWLAYFIERENDIDAGLTCFTETEVMKAEQLNNKIEWGTAIKEVAIDDAKIFSVAAVYGALEGKPGLVLRDGKEIKKMLQGAQAKGQTATEFLESLNGSYFETDIKSMSQRMFNRACLAQLALLLAVQVGGDKVADHLLDKNPQIASAATVVASPEPETTTTTETTLATTTTAQPSTITTAAPTTITVPVTTTQAPTTTAPPPAPTTTSAPPRRPSQYQKDLGEMIGFDLNGQSVEYIAQKLRENTGENWNEATYRAATGKDSGYVGRNWVNDCPEGAILILDGDTLDDQVDRNGVVVRKGILSQHNLTHGLVNEFNQVKENEFLDIQAGLCLDITDNS